MSESTGAPESAAMSEEQVRAYMEQLRSAPAEQVLSELLSVLLNAAQSKLGRHDARLLIDLSAIMIGHARPYVSGDLARQVDQALGQLRMAQVQAENAAAGEREPNDLAQRPAPPADLVGDGQPAGAEAAPAQPQPQQPRSPASGLWVPGRDF